MVLFPFFCLCRFACLRSFTDWCIGHRQQSCEQKKTRQEEQDNSPHHQKPTNGYGYEWVQSDQELRIVSDKRLRTCMSGFVKTENNPMLQIKRHPIVSCFTQDYIMRGMEKRSGQKREVIADFSASWRLQPHCEIPADVPTREVWTMRWQRPHLLLELPW